MMSAHESKGNCSLNSLRKETPFLRPAFAPCVSSASYLIEPLAPPHAGHDEHDLCRGRASVNGVQQPDTGSNHRHARVIGAGIMPCQPHEDRSTAFFNDELSQLLAAQQQGFLVLGNFGGAATPVSGSQVALEHLQTVHGKRSRDALKVARDSTALERSRDAPGVAATGGSGHTGRTRAVFSDGSFFYFPVIGFLLFCAAPPHTYSNPATFDGGPLGAAAPGPPRYMRVVSKFCYLGDMLSRSCDDAYAVPARVESAGMAFSALRKCVFASSSVSAAAKAAAYEGIVLAILLFRSESWFLPERLLQQVRTLHARCAHTMCRVTRESTHGSTTSRPRT